jgi:ribosomal protein L34E
MLPLMTTVSLPQVYCGGCHLSTRSDVARCLHCNKPLQAAPVVRGRAMRREKPVQGAGKRVASR